MAIAKAEQGSNSVTTVEYTDEHIYARPMYLKDQLDSSVTISITEKGSQDPPRKWQMEKVIKSVPTGLWAQCKFPKIALIPMALSDRSRTPNVK